MRTNGFSVHVHEGHGALWVSLAGELDIGVVETIDDACGVLLASNGEVVVVNVAGLQFCDVAGGRALVRWHAAGAVLFGAPSCLQRLFELTGQSHRLPADTRDAWPSTRRVESSGHQTESSGFRRFVPSGNLAAPRLGGLYPEPLSQ